MLSENAIKEMTSDALAEFDFGAWSSSSSFHSVYHELGYAVEHMLIDNNRELYLGIGDLYKSTHSAIMGTDVWVKEGVEVSKYAAKEAGFSYYGLSGIDEFVAESVAQYFCSDNPSGIAKSVVKMLIGE